MKIRPALLAALVALAPTSALAQDVAGALTGHVAIADGDVGGGAMVDVWAPIDWLRLGGFLGVTSIPSSRDSHNRVATPIGASIAAVIALSGPVRIEVRARGGFWGGATQEVKLTIGGFFGGGAYLAFDLGGGVSLGGGLEVWAILGAGSTWCVTPGLELSWGSPVAEPTPE